MQAYVIMSRDGVIAVHIGTHQAAILKSNELAKKEFDSWSDELRAQCEEAARRHGNKRTGFEYYRDADKWAVKLAPYGYTIEIKP
jgi:hypothetical protein